MQNSSWSIETQGLVKQYGEITAVDGIDLQIPRHVIYALLGPNGAGKTTTIEMLTTITRPTTGKAIVAGYDVVKQPADVRRRIGATFQDVVLDDALTGRELLHYHGRLYGQKKAVREAKITELLAMVELEEAADRPTRTYSGGMKRRLELVRGLMTEPEILFLDEPTQGLDPQNRANIWDYIRDLKARKGLTLLLTTHYMEEAEQLADLIAIIDHGKIIVQDTPRNMVDSVGSDAIVMSGSNSPNGFMERVQALPFVQSTSAEENQVRLGVDSGSHRLPEIITLASETGYLIEDMSIAKPSLEDVFLKYTGRQLRDH